MPPAPQSKSGFTDEDLKSEEIQITVKGRKSGKNISLPVWFIVHDRERKLFLLPIHGTSSTWYKNLVKTPAIQISLGKKQASVQARSVRDRDRVEEVTEKFRQKYGADQIKKYYDKLDTCVEISF